MIRLLTCTVALLGWANAALADIDEGCLAVENAFANNQIERLAELKPKQVRWQALQSFRLAAAYIPSGDKSRARKAVKTGLSRVKAGLKAQPDDAELLLLGAMLDGQYFLINRWRLMHNGLRALRRLRRAEKIAPNSRRVALMRGTAKVVAPSFFGGDPQAALPLFSATLDDSVLCDNGDWAQVDILNWLARAHAKLGNPAQAQEFYAKALARSPDNYWVKVAIAGAGYEWDPEADEEDQ